MSNHQRVLLSFVLCCCGAVTVLAQSGGSDKPGQAGERVYKAAEVTQKAKILVKPQPSCDDALQNEVDGSVVLRAVLSSSGDIKDISVVEGLPHGLTEKSVEAAKGIKFEPATKDGKPVSQSIMLEYNFNIYTEDDVDRKAAILDQPMPECTEEARRNKFSETVLVRTLLMRSGEVRRIGFPTRTPPYGLSEKIKQAAKQIKFTPAERGGRPVSQLATIEYSFTAACK